jgi:hypothetical protein
MGAMRATVVRALPNRKGKPVLRRFPDHRTRLLGYDRACRLTGATEDEQGYGADAEFEPDHGTLGGLTFRASGREYWSEGEGCLANPHSDLTSTDMMLMRSCTEKVIRMVELGGGTPAEVVARIVARTKESTGVGSTQLGPFEPVSTTAAHARTAKSSAAHHG